MTEIPEAPLTVDELRERLRAAGLGERIDELVRDLTRPRVRLVAGEPGREEPQGTRLGGRPWMGHDVEWPLLDGEFPLALIAQVNLADVAPLLPAGTLPPEGILCFFYEADEQSCWGLSPEEKDAWRVVYTAPGAAGGLHELPEEMPEYCHFPAVPLTASAAISCAPWEGPASRLLAGEAGDRWRQVTTMDTGQAASLWGYPHPVQGEVESDVELASRGLYPTAHNRHPERPEGDELARQASRWRLLLQVDSVDAARMTWGDVGSLYFMITEDDARAGRFEDVWMTLQCF